MSPATDYHRQQYLLTHHLAYNAAVAVAHVEPGLGIVVQSTAPAAAVVCILGPGHSVQQPSTGNTFRWGTLVVAVAELVAASEGIVLDENKLLEHRMASRVSLLPMSVSLMYPLCSSNVVVV